MMFRFGVSRSNKKTVKTLNVRVKCSWQEIVIPDNLAFWRKAIIYTLYHIVVLLPEGEEIDHMITIPIGSESIQRCPPFCLFIYPNNQIAARKYE